MPRFAANLSLLFQEHPLPERFAAARDAGFEAVEILFPYDMPVADILKPLKETGLPVVLINTPPPNWTGGDRGFAALPGRQERFRHDFKRSMRYAEVLGVQIVHVMSGIAEGVEARATLIENLRWATAFVPEQQLTIEPINTVDMPGYFLSDFDLAAEILDEVDAPNLGLQFDAYHAQRIAGDVMGLWHAHKARVVHVQIADAPGRGAPGSGGMVDFGAFFSALDAEGYAGFVSAEYHPGEMGTVAELDWIRAYLP